MAIQGSVRMNSCALRSISPQAGTGSCTPSPRNDSDASSRIAWPTKAVIMIRYGAITFGTM